MRVPGIGSPRAVLQAARRALDDREMCVEAFAPIIASAPVGPSSRQYANGAALVLTGLMPPAFLDRLKQVEARFGRRRRGQRWRARPLDLDIILWSGGSWHDSRLDIPHIAFRARPFVLRPASRIAPNWRDPVSGLPLRTLYARLTQPRPLPR